MNKNIIVLVVDSLSYECMCGTYKNLKAPFLNKLAKDPFEYKNLVGRIKIKDKRVQFLLSKLKERHKEIIRV